MTNDKSLDTNEVESDNNQSEREEMKRSSLSIDSHLVKKGPSQDIESRIEEANLDQFAVRYRPARKYLVSDFVLNSNNTISSGKNYDSRLRLFVDYLQESQNVTPHEASVNDVRGFLWFMGSEYQRAETTLRGYKSTIKKCFEFLHVNNSVPDPKITATEIARISTAKYALQKHTFERDDMSKEEIDIMIETADNSRNKLLLKVFYETGIRNDDAAELKLPHLHLEKAKIDINDTKGGYDYTLPIREELSREISGFIRTEREEWDAGSEYLFPSKEGGRLCNGRITEIVKEIAWEAGNDIQRVVATIKTTQNQPDSFGDERKIHRVTPHTFRHSIVTHLGDNEVDESLQKVLTGHKSDIVREYDHSDSTTAFDILRESIRS